MRTCHCCVELLSWSISSSSSDSVICKYTARLAASHWAHKPVMLNEAKTSRPRLRPRPRQKIII